MVGHDPAQQLGELLPRIPAEAGHQLVHVPADLTGQQKHARSDVGRTMLYQ